MIVDEQLQQEIIAHCKDLSPNQACGLVLRDEMNCAKLVYPCKNLGAWPYGFHIDPDDYYAAFKKASKNGWNIGGVYHCHNASEATPTGRDLRRAVPKGVCYIIASLLDKNKPEIKGFYFENGSPVEINFKSGSHNQ